jgi:putative spermidine/putrescine transport system permease protein
VTGRRGGRILLWVLAGLLIAFLALPSLVVIPVSFTSGQSLRFPPPGFSLRWYGEFFDPRGEWLSATFSSLQVSAAAALLSTVVGTLASFGLVRGRIPGRRILLAFFVAPLIVPVVVLAAGMLFVVLRMRLGTVGSAIPLVGAHSVLGIPLVVLNVASSLSRVDPDLELAASGLGGGRLQVLRRVTLPLILPGIVAGALLSFVISWDEVVIAIFLTTPYFRTLPVLLWGQVKFSLDPTVAVVAAILTLITTAALGAFVILRRREVWR